MTKSIYFILVLFACQPPVQKGVELITSEQLKELKLDGIEIVDIRTSGEYSAGHIPGVPNIDFMDANFSNLISKKDKSKPLIIHCASGGRSKRASTQLIEMGFTKVYDYTGGFSDWKAKGEEIEK